MTVVGGKLTTYRQMAEDAVDAAVAGAGARRGPCRTRTLPLAGAASRAELAEARARRPGWSAASAPTPRWCSTRRATVSGLSDAELLAPISDGTPATLAELLFGVTHEGAADVDDLLDRRTRIGLVPADRDGAVPAAERALSLVRARAD